MSSNGPRQFGVELEGGRDTDTVFNRDFGHGYFGNSQVDIQNDLSKTLELEGYSFSESYYPPSPVYIPPSENWSTTSSYSELLLPPVPVSSPPDDSPYNVSVMVQPPKVFQVGEKRPRLAEFGEENILPEDKVRKRVKTSRYVEQ
jgi:hypothetical protein